MTAYHKWLIRQRVYCEKCLPPKPAVTTIKENGHDVVVCAQCAGITAQPAVNPLNGEGSTFPADNLDY